MANHPQFQTRFPGQYNTAISEVYTDRVERYRHSFRWQGGPWEATWFFPLNKKNTKNYLRRFYANMLAHLHEASYGGVVIWRGLIVQMRLTLDGYRVKRDMLDVANAVKTFYIDTTDTAQETSWYQDGTSQKRYTRIEHLLFLNDVTTAQAQAAAQTYLTEHKEAHSLPIQIGQTGAEGLEVTAVGPVFTANFKYVTASAGSTYSDYLTNIINTDCPFLQSTNIYTNSLASTAMPFDTKCWDAMLELTKRGDASGNPWRLYSDPNGYMTYKQADPTPAYEWRGSSQGVTQPAGHKVAPWLVKPAVIRNMTEAEGTPIPGSFLLDKRDNWITEVEMAMGQEQPTLKPAGITPEELESKQSQYSAWIRAKEDAD